MRCPNCAGEVPAGSRFCGICGRNVTVAPEPIAHALGDAAAGGQWPATAPAAARRDAQPSMSLFELPAARGARTAKMALVLVLDAILAGAGIVMFLSYLDARTVPPGPAKKPAPAAKGVVEKTQEKQATGDRQQPTGDRQQATGDRQQATGNRQPKAPPIGGAAPSRPAEAPVAVAGPDDGQDTVDDVEEVSGRLSQVVARHAADLERCYQRVAKVSGPGEPLEGRIDLHVTVMPDGSARDVRAGENTTGSAQLADCAVSLFRTVSLPSGAAAPVELVWPLQFRRSD